MSLQKEITSHIRIVEDFPQAGISFKDFSQVFHNPNLSKKIIQDFVKQADGKVDMVCGIESRGFILGFALALELDVPFILVRKQGKLPPPVVSASYDLEYGSATLEIVENHIPQGANVLIHDDVLATGGTAAACAKLIESVDANPAMFAFLIELDFLKGRQKIEHIAKIYSTVNYNS